jgi:hypothetical protein
LPGEFDPDAKLEAVDALCLDDLLRQFGGVGERNGPRTGAGKRTTISNEAYLARRLLIWLCEKGLIGFPISLKHTDRPDFIITSAGVQFGLEVTEACDERDGAEMAAAERAEKPQSLGAFGGRGGKGYQGTQPEREVIADIQKALTAKSEKSYAADRPTDLLIYVNSNPARVVQREEHFQFVESFGYDVGSMRRVFLFWSTDRVTQIASPIPS